MLLSLCQSFSFAWYVTDWEVKYLDIRHCSCEVFIFCIKLRNRRDPGTVWKLPSHSPSGIPKANPAVVSFPICGAFLPLSTRPVLHCSVDCQLTYPHFVQGVTLLQGTTLNQKPGKKTRAVFQQSRPQADREGLGDSCAFLGGLASCFTARNSIQEEKNFHNTQIYCHYLLCRRDGSWKEIWFMEGDLGCS